MESIEIITEYIKLEQLLKLAEAVESGADAKACIQEGLVKVNGKIELQRGKKLRKGDRIDYDGKQYLICTA